MTGLDNPSPELARRLLTELEYAERLVGYAMSPTTGNMARSLYSLQEVYDFLTVGEPEEALLRGGGTTSGYLDFGELRQWLEKVCGDHDLAAAVTAAEAGAANYRDRILATRSLFGERLKQCRAVVAAEAGEN